MSAARRDAGAPVGVVLRPATSDDAAACAALYAPFVRDTAISFEIEPPTPGEMERRIRAARDHPWLLCRAGETLLGYAYASPHRARPAYRWSVDVSVYGNPEHRRRGVGGALYGALLEILALQGFQRAFAGITLPNPASVALHESCGFTPLGVYRRVGFKRGAWQDVGWWERDLHAASDAPAEPRSFAEIAESPPVEAALTRAAARVRDHP